MTVQQIYADSKTNEGYLLSFSATVANARNGTGSQNDATNQSPTVLFGINAGTYYDALGYLEFDTSSLAGKNILSATLSLYMGSTGTDTQSQALKARLYDYGSSLSFASGGWRDPTQFSACTLLAHLNNYVSATASPGYYDLTSDALAANISKSGMTRMVLASSLHASAGTPTGYTGVTIDAITNQPLLTVTIASFSGFDARSRRTYLRR